MSPAPKPPDLTTYSGRFAARLRALREKTGMTGQEMAKAVSDSGYVVKERSYYAWESGANSPPFDAIPFISKALGLKNIRTLMPED